MVKHYRKKGVRPPDKMTWLCKTVDVWTYQHQFPLQEVTTFYEGEANCEACILIHAPNPKGTAIKPRYLHVRL